MQLVTSFREPTCLGVMGGLMKRKVLHDGEVSEAVKWLKSLVWSFELVQDWP